MNGTLTQQEVEGITQELIQRGFTPQQVEAELVQIEAERKQVAQETYSSAFQSAPTDNLVKWQLELNDILERADHILREDIPQIIGNKIVWKLNPHQDRRILNDYGVKEIMRILTMYINRNTILADYDPSEIQDIVYDFAKEVNDLIFMKYEDFGLTTLEKRKNYPMIHREITDLVHSAYKRAQYGGERQSLREARQIHQQEQLGQQYPINIQTGEQKRERGVLNPMRYVLGRYK